MSRCSAISVFPEQYWSKEYCHRGYSAVPCSQQETTSSPQFCRELWLACNDFQSAHVGLQHVRHGNGTIIQLIGLHDSDQRTANGGARAIQGMHESRLAVGPAGAGIHAAGLEIPAYRAARNFPVGAALALPGHPDLDIVGL